MSSKYKLWEFYTQDNDKIYNTPYFSDLVSFFLGLSWLTRATVSSTAWQTIMIGGFIIAVGHSIRSYLNFA
jgi:hypothetical protein